MIRKEKTTIDKIAKSNKMFMNISQGEYMFYTSLLDDLKVVIDVGAADSFFNKLKCEVHFFEPDTKEFNYLISNTEKKDSYYFNKIGLGSESSKMLLYNELGSTEWRGNGRKKTSEEIEIITLNSYIKKHDIKNIDLIKIDVEGMEYEVIKGCDEYFDICKIITFEYGRSWDSNYKKIKELLSPKFDFYLINPNGNLTKLDYPVGVNYGNIACIKK